MFRVPSHVFSLTRGQCACAVFRACSTAVRQEPEDPKRGKDAQEAQRTSTTKKRQSKSGRNALILPKVHPATLDGASTILGIHLSTSVVSWAALNRQMQVLDWNYAEFSEPDSPLSIHTTVGLAMEITEKLPTCDLYVAEDIKGLKKLGRKSEGMTIQEQQQLTAAVMTILASRTKSVDNCFVMRSQLSARYFNLLVGNETVSTDAVMEQILSGNQEHPDEEIRSLDVPGPLRDSFDALIPVFQQQMSWSLLKALTFVAVQLHQRSLRR